MLVRRRRRLDPHFEVWLFSSLLAAALNAKALHYNETICKKEEVQKFLSQLVSKPPEVGHYVTCFHPAKAPDVKTNQSRKVKKNRFRHLR